MEKFKELLNEIDLLFEAYKNRKPVTDDEARARYEKLRLEWTYNSNAIEGNSLSLKETSFYLREGLTSEGKPLIDYLEARNHTEAIDWLFEIVENRKPISEGFLKELNALLHKGITERPAIGSGGEKTMRRITPGAYKTQPNHVLTLSGEIHYYVEPLKVRDEMQALVMVITENEDDLHPIELATLAHYEITRIHPFDDCNGRGARILLNLILMQSGFPPIVIKIEERREYLEALERADQGEKEIFYTFIAQHIKNSLNIDITS
jgi:Fic family protein